MISSLLAHVTVTSNGGAAGGLLAGGLGLIFVLIGIACFVLWIWALISALSSNMSSTEKLVWVVVIIFLPVLGPILYLVIGRK
jgi:Phospholipase_D-nuclease N-terminal